MARFNTRQTVRTTNHEGAPAYRLSKELELYSAVVTSTLSDSFYEKADDRLDRIQGLIKQVDPVFVAKLAVYTRNEMYLRSIPLVLLVELAKVHSGDDLVRRATERTVLRADEITELLAYYALANGRTGTKRLNRLSHQVRNGLASAFNSFDEYQFSKYNRDGGITLKDALSVVCPAPKDAAQQALFDRIMADSLETAYTWETKLSDLGKQKFSSAEEKKIEFREAWRELIQSGRMGYMATLRNLRNILEAEVGQVHIDTVCDYLADGESVRRSRQLPFRFLSAYRSLTGDVPSAHAYNRRGKATVPPQNKAVYDALEKAIVASVANIPGFSDETRVYIAGDTSGSMEALISQKGSILRAEIALLLGQLLGTKCRSARTGIFGEHHKEVALPGKKVLENSISLAARIGEVGHSTNGFLVADYLLEKQIPMDKVFMFTDCELWDSGSSYGRGYRTLKASWAKYKAFCPEAKLYMMDLAGYGTVPVQLDKGVLFVSGWSDRIFSVLEYLDAGQSAIDKIRGIEL